ncbi:alpha/beta hydrolase [Flavobacterium sp. JP2137]|uniref:alpha/beta hydrolase n=1 Tax=Flavobacterium sp. JP2137 TaxID=3414510 RepID=UPI003D2FA7C8
MSTSLFYLVREPEVILDKNPMLLLLHGYGSNEEDLFSFAAELPKTHYVISARAPYPMPPYGNAWYAINFDADQNKFSDDQQAISSRDTLVTFIDELLALYPIDSQKVSLIGFSQGAILSYALALSYPEKIEKVVALSGYFNPNIIADNYREKDLSKLRFFVSHGSVDQVVPVEWARKTPAILEDLKIPYEYKEYPVGHGVAPQNFMDLLRFILEK